MADVTQRTDSERGTIEGRRTSPFGGLFDWEPFRNFMPNTYQQYGMDVIRREDGYDVEIPTPGFRPQDMEITYQDGIVTVLGRGERRTLRRSFTLPEDIDEENITADVENGMLVLHLKQHPRQQPKRIQVRGGTTGETQASLK